MQRIKTKPQYQTASGIRDTNGLSGSHSSLSF